MDDSEFTAITSQAPHILEALQEAVDAGAAKLTYLYGPEWPGRIDLGTFDMNNVFACVATQVWKSFHDIDQDSGYIRLSCELANADLPQWLDTWSMPPEAKQAARAHGFVCGTVGFPGDNMCFSATMRVLTELWLRKIRSLLGETAAQQAGS